MAAHTLCGRNQLHTQYTTSSGLAFRLSVRVPLRNAGASLSVGRSSPNTSPRYFYVYNGHGDVVALVDVSGTVIAHYRYDEFGNLTVR